MSNEGKPPDRPPVGGLLNSVVNSALLLAEADAVALVVRLELNREVLC